MLITSTQNETIKRAKALRLAKERAERELHIVEGETLVMEALHSGQILCEAFIEEGHSNMLQLLEAHGSSVFVVSRSVMESLCQAKTPQWVAATVKTPPTKTPEAYLGEWIVALDAVQDPGNLGVILRTADAMGAAGILLGEGCADPYALKTLRAAMGSTYHIPVWKGLLLAELNRLKEQGFALLCGHLKGEQMLPEALKAGKYTLVIGNEGHGVSEEVAKVCYKYKMPMAGRAESLNAGVFAGIMMHELTMAVRERENE